MDEFRAGLADERHELDFAFAALEHVLGVILVERHVSVRGEVRLVVLVLDRLCTVDVEFLSSHLICELVEHLLCEQVVGVGLGDRLRKLDEVALRR